MQASMRVTGVERFKGNSGEKAIVEFLFICQPTGYGKSLCVAHDYLHEVKRSSIAPLTALMMEQKTKYTHQGLILEFSGELQHSICNVRERILRNLQWRHLSQLLLSDVY